MNLLCITHRMHQTQLFVYLLVLTCPTLPPVHKTHICERYNVVTGFETYECDVNHAFPVTGSIRVRVCQVDGRWSEAVEPCQRKYMYLTCDIIANTG